MCFYQKFSQWGFCNLNVVLTSKIRCPFLICVFIINTHLSKGIQNKMLKVWSFTENELCHIHFHNNLPKISPTNILESGTGQILLIVVLMIGKWLKLPIEIADSNDSIFTCPPSLHIFLWILRTVMYPSAKVRHGACQASKILFARKLNVRL